MLRQSRWREAIASSFDRAELRPFLGNLVQVTVSYAARAGSAHRDTNIIKPLYHVAWLASRLGMVVATPLREEPAVEPAGDVEPGRTGALRAGRRRVDVALRPTISTTPPGTTLTVELTARRRKETLEVVVSAEADVVIVRTTLAGKQLPERRFMAPRRAEVDLLVETVESVGPDPVAVAALLTAAELVDAG